MKKTELKQIIICIVSVRKRAYKKHMFTAALFIIVKK